MRDGIGRLLLVLVFLAGGCAGRGVPEAANRVTIFVPGAAGDGAWYDGLNDAMTARGMPVRTMTWGAPKAFFFANFSNAKTHDAAERKLAALIDQQPATVERIDLIGHSAGCGVILGGVARANRDVETIVLLAPSVSPGYDLKPTLARVRGTIHNFYSSKDVTFLKWRTGNFGTYDRIKTAAAGHAGFDTRAAKIVEHAYNPSWTRLGNDGSHVGPVSGEFVREMVSPLLESAAE